MALPGTTTSVTANNYNTDNGTGAQVRAKINDIFQALRTFSSQSSDPSGAANLVQFQPQLLELLYYLKFLFQIYFLLLT